MPITCFICANENSKRSAVLIPLKLKTYEKCEIVLSAKKTHGLRYGNVTLPKSFSEYGYHVSCYKDFTALKKNLPVSSIPETSNLII